MFKEITKEDIDEYEKHYKGSDEEKEDLFEAYTTCKGDMKKYVNHQGCHPRTLLSLCSRCVRSCCFPAL